MCSVVDICETKMVPRLVHITAFCFLILPFLPLFQLLNHALLHHVDVGLLFFETPARHLNVLLKELELVNA